MKDLIRVGLVAAVGCLASAGHAGENPDWVQKSNEAAQPLLEYITKYTPESGSSIGIDQADEGVIDLKPNVYARSKADGEKIVQQLQAKESAESDPKVRRDLAILITALQNGLETRRLNQELMLPFYDVAQILFDGLEVLLDPRNSSSRQPKPIVRLPRYPGQAAGSTPPPKLPTRRPQL